MAVDNEAFQLEEYKQLRTEVTALLSRIELLFRYSIIVAATVLAWLLSNSLGASTVTQACLKLPSVIAQLGWFIPPAFILFAGLMARITVYRAKLVEEYLGRVENSLGSPTGGWQAFIGPKPNVLTISTGTVWALLFVCSVVAAGIGISVTAEAKTVCTSTDKK